ncbi:MAG: hypothetical protein R3240_09270 [Gammaproteobacteria bacterium]|nr:hypothetical protein [Gammaproteobacteria bacterium]
MKYLIQLNIFLLISWLCFLFLSGNVYASRKEVIVTGKAVVTDTITLQQARNQALNQARSLAVEQAAGVNVNTSTLLENALVVSELVKTFSHGFLINEEILEWHGEWLKTRDQDELGLPVVTVKIKGIVDVSNQQFLRNFILEAGLNKKTFRQGELAELEISSTEDIFLLIVNYTSNNTIVPAFPFAENIPNLLYKNTSLQLPGDYARHLEIAMTTFKGHKKDTEAFIFLGIPVTDRTKSIPWYRMFPAGKAISYDQFFARLLELELPWLAEKTIIYSVVEH